MKSRANEKNKQRSLWMEAWRRLRKNKLAMAGLGFILLLVVLALFTIAVDLITQNSFYTEHVVKQNLRLRLQGPSTVAIGISVVIGSILGAIAGFYGKVVDNVIMRIMDIFLAIPSMLLALAIVAAFGTSLTNLLIAIAISYVPTFARTVRASVLTVKDQEYIEAAKALGASDARIIGKYIIPNCLAPLIVQASLGVAGAILSIAGLSFLGLGIQPPTPEWGSMLSNARSYIRDGWHITVIPGLMIMLTILSLNVLGDGLRDALDPRLKN